MTSRGRSRSRILAEGSQESFQLVDRSGIRATDEDGSGEDIYPDSDASILRQHHRRVGDETEAGEIGVLDRLTFLISRVPYFGKDKASRNQAFDSSLERVPSGDFTVPHNDNQRHIRRSGKTTTARSSASLPSYGSWRQKDGSTSRSRDAVRRTSVRSSSPMLIAEPGHPAGQGGHLSGGIALATSDTSDEEEEAISIDGDDVTDSPDNSPYPEVRASVPATDDTSLSINTPRMWILSILCAFVGSATNLFFSLRYPSVAITPIIALVVVHPLGRFWDRLFKRDDDSDEIFENGALMTRTKTQHEYSATSPRTKLRLWLAQGTWNEKEHACVYVSSNVSFGFAFATDVIVEQSKFYHQDPSIIYQLLLTISTQILGYAFAGLTRRFLVRPPSMIWPGTLMSTAMFSTMHSSENKSANGWVISRWKFFLSVWSGSFAWYLLPGLLFPALSYFSVVTWFAPKNVVVADLFGVVSGLGLFPATFDWAQIAYIGSPLLTPFWAAANVVGGLVLVIWIIAPIMYYRNALFSAYMPIISSLVFDDTGKPYDVSRILTPNYEFDHEAYNNYSKVYLPITYVLSYGVQFASLSALVTHTACWHGREIWQQSSKSFTSGRGKNKSEYQPVNQEPTKDTSQKPWRSSKTGPWFVEADMTANMGGEDVHNRLMQRYDDAPMIWYLSVFLAMLAIGVFVVEYYPVYLPWYGLLLALSITGVLFIPVGIVMAITNQHSSLYLICQLICGVIFPGRPVANMVFVTYCYISSAQGIKFASDLKLGHYMKIPPRLLFKVQLVATLISSVTQIGVLNWMFKYIPGICTPEAINGFTCPIARVHFNGSILWGVVGPQRFFGVGALYRPLIWAFAVGFVAPIFVWIVGRRRASGSVWRKINFPVLFGSLSWIPPATGLNFSTWALVCFLFNSVLPRRAPAWWGKYTMTLSAALDSGLAFGVVVVFFGFLYPAWGWLGSLEWWGMRVFKEGCDWNGCPYLTLKEGEHFG